MNAANEIKPEDADKYSKKLSKDFIEETFDIIVKKYTEGSIEKRLLINALMSLPWSETIKIAYGVLLDLGRDDDGSYKSTKDTLLGSLSKYFGE
jgi:hypothetical protein